MKSKFQPPYIVSLVHIVPIVSTLSAVSPNQHIQEQLGCASLPAPCSKQGYLYTGLTNGGRGALMQGF